MHGSISIAFSDMAILSHMPLLMLALNMEQVLLLLLTLILVSDYCLQRLSNFLSLSRPLHQLQLVPVLQLRNKHQSSEHKWSDMHKNLKHNMSQLSETHSEHKFLPVAYGDSAVAAPRHGTRPGLPAQQQMYLPLQLPHPPILVSLQSRPYCCELPWPVKYVVKHLAAARAVTCPAYPHYQPSNMK